MEQNEKHFSATPSIDLSVIIAIFNEEKIVGELLSRCDVVLSATALDYEIVVVDDGSRDRTIESLRNHLGSIRGLRIVELYRNVGQVAAISAGMSVAKGAWVLMMDGDLQHLPEDIPRFLSAAEGGYDFVASYREKREDSLRRKAITRVVNAVNRILLGVNITDFGSAFRLIRSEIIMMMKDRQGYVHYSTPDLFINAQNFIEIPIVQARRKSGSSKWTMLAFVMFNFDFLVTAMRPVLFAVCGSICGIIIGMVLYLLHIVGAIGVVQALTGPVSILLISVLMFMLSVIWREIVLARKWALGNPPFLIRNVSTAATPLIAVHDTIMAGSLSRPAADIHEAGRRS